MMNVERSSETGWRPAPRPTWVNAINEEASHLDIASLIPLDPDLLVAQAIAKTGLQDFGPDDWREPFDVLVRSLRDEAGLNLIGRLMTGEDLLAMLEARLRVEHAYALHPEIDNVVIEQPLFILGQPRTGTSALQNLLASNPTLGTIRTYEAWFPAPVTSAADDEQQRIQRTTDLTAMWNKVTPELASQHEINALIPTECNLIHGLTFRSRTMVHLGQIPAYNAWMAKADMAPAFAYHKRILKLLQFRHGYHRWVLKSPDYLTMIPDILKHYPDCGLIFTHRDPVKAFGSAISLIGTLQWQRSDQIFRYESRASHIVNLEAVSSLFDGVIDMIENGTISDSQLLNLPFNDIAHNPIETAERVYSHFDIPLDQSSMMAMADYVEENKKSRQDHIHNYSSGSPEYVKQARTLFGRYQKYFSVVNEV